MAEDLPTRSPNDKRSLATEPGLAVVVGVGNRLRGDDAVGPILLDTLAGLDRARLFDVGSTPENYILPIAQLAPARILVVDACDFGARPGEFELFDRSQVERLTYGLLSTHTLPLSLTIEMLVQETDAAVFLLGVQPAAMEFGTELSAPVSAALPALAEFVRRWVTG